MERTKTAVSKMNKEVLLAPKSERVEMTLNTSSALTSGLLIQRLTELYENPIEASVRETVSNAIDAVSVMHSGARPMVSIEAPTILNPVLVVSDNGLGMSYEDLKEIYSKYGASTKTNDFNQVGAYGLGAKAPLAYGTEFTVTSTKDGVKTTIIVAKEELTNYIKIIDSVHTDEPSGTTVSIPVSNEDIDKFVDYINNYEKYPMEKDIDFIINGKQKENSKYVLINNGIKIFQSEEEVITGRVWLRKAMEFPILTEYTVDDVMQKVGFLIGGWVYCSPASRKRGNESFILVELKAGVVGFNSSRDAILNNDRSDTLNALVKEYVKSDVFSSNLVDLVNKMPVNQFKHCLSEFAIGENKHLFYENGEIVRKIENRSGRWWNREFKVDLENLVHKETGYSLKSALAGFPESVKFTSYMYVKESYKKTPDFNLYVEKDRLCFFVSKASEISLNIKNFLGHEKTDDFSGFFIKEILLNDWVMVVPENHSTISRNDSLYNVLFITGVDTPEKATKLSKMRARVEELYSRASEFLSTTRKIVVVNCSKKTIEKVCETAGLIKEMHFIKTYEEVLEEVANNKTTQSHSKGKREVAKRPLIEVQHIDGLNITDSTKKKVIVCRDMRSNNISMTKLKNWYANTNKIKINDFDMFFTTGQITSEDAEYLLKIADDVLREDGSGFLGRSNLYNKKIHNNVCKEALFYELEKDYYSELELVIEIVAALKGCSPRELARVMIENQKSHELCARMLGIEGVGYEVKESDFYKVLENNKDEAWKYRNCYSSTTAAIALKAFNGLSESTKMNMNEILSFMGCTKIFMWDLDKNKFTVEYCRNRRLNVDEYDLKSFLEDKERTEKFISRHTVLEEKRIVEDLHLIKDIFEIIKELKG